MRSEKETRAESQLTRQAGQAGQAGKGRARSEIAAALTLLVSTTLSTYLPSITDDDVNISTNAVIKTATQVMSDGVQISLYPQKSKKSQQNCEKSQEFYHNFAQNTWDPNVPKASLFLFYANYLETLTLIFIKCALC